MPSPRHPTATLPFSARRHFAATLVCDADAHPGEASCLLIRRRLAAGAAGSRLVLSGSFDAVVRPRLLSALAALPADDRPLAVDLTRALSLDRDTLHLLLGAHSSGRPVLFRVAATGAVRRMIFRLGLEERMGLTAAAPLEAPVSLPPLSLPALPLPSFPDRLARPAPLEISGGGRFNG